MFNITHEALEGEKLVKGDDIAPSAFAHVVCKGSGFARMRRGTAVSHNLNQTIHRNAIIIGVLLKRGIQDLRLHITEEKKKSRSGVRKKKVRLAGTSAKECLGS